MYEQIETSIKSLATKANTSNSGDALKFSQAALNLAHIVATLEGAKQLAEEKL